MNVNQIKTWIENSELYNAMPGSEKLTIKQQVKLVGAMAEMTGKTEIIEDCRKALDILK